MPELLSFIMQAIILDSGRAQADPESGRGVLYMTVV